jgi:hypothetical protein
MGVSRVTANTRPPAAIRFFGVWEAISANDAAEKLDGCGHSSDPRHQQRVHALARKVGWRSDQRGYLPQQLQQWAKEHPELDIEMIQVAALKELQL